MLDRISNVVLGLDGMGHAGQFADYSQWEQWQETQQANATEPTRASDPYPTESGDRSASAKKKLSYLDARDYATIESRVTEAEELLAAKQAILDLTEVVTDPARLQSALAEVEAAQDSVDALYARWAELEAKQ
jgi:ATP-binding cassette subfamily F protein uup